MACIYGGGNQVILGSASRPRKLLQLHYKMQAPRNSLHLAQILHLGNSNYKLREFYKLHHCLRQALLSTMIREPSDVQKLDRSDSACFKPEAKRKLSNQAMPLFVLSERLRIPRFL